ncbi:MAG: multicopper oxidase domain-containing protein [Cytophagales bacterium]
MRHKVLFVIICFLSLSAKSQNVVSYNLEAQMDAIAQLWNNDSLIIWGFKDLNNPLSTQATLPGPTIYCEEGDSVIITMTNPSFEAHTIHLHGFDVDQNNDGVPSTSFFVQPGESGTYSFKADYTGNFLYHCHVGSVLHLQMGMYGAVIVRPANGVKEVYSGGPAYDREYIWLTHEIDKSWHDDYTAIGAFTNYFPDHFQINGKSKNLIYNDSSVSIYNAFIGERLHLRLLNIGYGINRYIFPAGLRPQVLTSDGRVLDHTYSIDTFEIYPGERYSLLLQANQLLQDSIQVQYLSMYRKEYWGTELIPIEVNALSSIDKKANRTFSIYPNPASNRIYIESDENAELQLFNLNGQLIESKKISKNSFLSIADLPNGVYIVKKTSKKGQIHSKLLIKKAP